MLESRYCWSSTGLAGDAYGVCASNIRSFVRPGLPAVSPYGNRSTGPRTSRGPDAPPQLDHGPCTVRPGPKQDAEQAPVPFDRNLVQALCTRFDIE